MDEPVTRPLTLSMLNTSQENRVFDKTDTEESNINDQSFGDLSMINVDEEDGPNQLDITDINMDPLTLSMLDTSNDSTIDKTDIEESFGGKRKTKRGGVRTRRNPKPSEKGQSYKATQTLKKNTIAKRKTNKQTMNELDTLFQGITIAPVSPQIGTN